MRMMAFVLVVWILASCASHTADPNLDAVAKTFRASDGKACIYVIPSSSTIEVTVRLDGQKLASLATENYLRLDVPPGKHVLSVTPSSLLPVFTGAPPDELPVEVEAGRCYFFRTIWTEFDRSWRQPRVYLERMKEDEGQRAVNVRTLIQPTQ